MSEPYTDAYGYPLTAIEAAKRAANPRNQGYYHNGVWHRRKPKKEPANDNVPAPRPADTGHT